MTDKYAIISAVLRLGGPARLVSAQFRSGVYAWSVNGHVFTLDTDDMIKLRRKFDGVRKHLPPEINNKLDTYEPFHADMTEDDQ